MWGLWTQEKGFWHFGFECPFSSERVGLSVQLSVSRTGAQEAWVLQGPKSVETVDLEVVDLTFWFRMLILKNKEQKEEGNGEK